MSKMIINQMSSEKTQSTEEEMRQTAIEVVDQAVEEGLSLCRGVVQRYIAYIQGVPVEQLFPEVQPTNEVGFLDKHKKQWFMKLDIVDDKFYRFPLEKCPGKVVRDTMEKVVRNLQLVFRMVLETEVDPSKVPHPERLMDSRLVLTPMTSCFVYNETHGRMLHDEFPRRIAFVWTAEGVDPQVAIPPAPVVPVAAVAQAVLPPEVHPRRPNIAVPCPHPDDFLGPRGAKNMPEEEISALIAQINPCVCTVCGGEDPAVCRCLE
jgi:hypothetical protein